MLIKIRQNFLKRKVKLKLNLNKKIIQAVLFVSRTNLVLSALNALAGIDIIVKIHHKHRRFLCALNVIFNLIN